VRVAQHHAAAGGGRVAAERSAVRADRVLPDEPGLQLLGRRQDVGGGGEGRRADREAGVCTVGGAASAICGTNTPVEASRFAA
jgi:hypothetical protein